MIRTGTQLAQRCMDVAENVKTLYVLGCFGWPMNYENQQRAIRSYSFNAGVERSAEIRAATADTFGFDCVCFVKALLWGWTGDADKEYGGAVYQSGGVPDIDDEQMLSQCKDVSDDFSSVQAGEYLWTDGHCGIYAGNGTAVECTYRWEDGVQQTAVYNMTGENGRKGRYWKKHGKLPYITYDAHEDRSAFLLQFSNLRRGSVGEAVRALQLLLIGMGYDCGSTGADGDFGKNTESAVISYQNDRKLDADGIAGRATMSSLLGVTE